MSENERALSQLMKAFDDAQQELRRVTDAIPVKPTLQAPNGLFTADFVAAYKAQVALYDQACIEKDRASTLVHEAALALDNWFPREVRDKMSQGIAIFTAAPSGAAGLRKVNGQYQTTYGRDHSDVRQRIQGY